MLVLLHTSFSAASGEQLGRAFQLVSPRGVTVARTMVRKGLLTLASSAPVMTYRLTLLGALLVRGGAAEKSPHPLPFRLNTVERDCLNHGDTHVRA
ncbi:hypothetical protein GO986_18560 [Deinococcus sp. HMF7620]|uniref:Uncharacterized protein n=1 Tax=Deinococcus arboris TaxID=2682977 RepID=A0A7C9MT88_9DEIO|nr:hypothetical protein [Deinococcus arboris]